MLCYAGKTQASLGRTKNAHQNAKTGNTSTFAVTSKHMLPTDNIKQLQRTTQMADKSSVNCGKTLTQEVGYQLRSGRSTSRNMEALKHTSKTSFQKRDGKPVFEAANKMQVATKSTTNRLKPVLQDPQPDTTADVGMTLSEFINAETNDVINVCNRRQSLSQFSRGSVTSAENGSPITELLVTRVPVSGRRSTRRSVLKSAAELPSTGNDENLSTNVAVTSDAVKVQFTETVHTQESRAEDKSLERSIVCKSSKSESDNYLKSDKCDTDEHSVVENRNHENVSHCAVTSMNTATTTAHGFQTPGQPRRGRSIAHELTGGSCHRKTPRNVRNSLILRKFSPDERFVMGFHVHLIMDVKY